MRFLFLSFASFVFVSASPVLAQEELPEPKPEKSCSVDKVKLSTAEMLAQIQSEITASSAPKASRPKQAAKEQAVAKSVKPANLGKTVRRKTKSVKSKATIGFY